ncbi:MAG: hypothetical protein JW733_05300 [Coriobacteriia bacterium]|nr:hypothetical protein [Coriobacteriia bacterium]MBN2839579.1 hypothetical protein [Coriobacteriia bacterium]
MRRTVVALVVAALAFVLVGCGGGADEPAADPAAADPAAAAPAPAAPVAPVYMTDRSANLDEATPTVFPSFTETITPHAFQAKLDARRPMLILFYDSEQIVTKEIRSEIDAVIASYRGLIDLVTFDVSGDGDPKAAEAATMYAAELGVQTTPHTLVVDRDAFIIWQWRGFVDKDTLRREVERATR